MRLSPIFVFAYTLFFSFHAHAQETVPGDPCTAGELNHTQQAGGPETSGIVHLMRCDGTAWQSYFFINTNGDIVVPSGIEFRSNENNGPGIEFSGNNNGGTVLFHTGSGGPRFSFNHVNGLGIGRLPISFQQSRIQYEEDGVLSQSFELSPMEFQIYKSRNGADGEFASLGWINNSDVFGIATEAYGLGKCETFLYLAETLASILRNLNRHSTWMEKFKLGGEA